jgi:hypothetical protein
MKRYLRIGILVILAVAVTLPAWSARNTRADEGQQNNEYYVESANHRQELGGKSERAWRGLSRAAENKGRRRVDSSEQPEKPSQDADDDVSKGKK